MITSEEFKNVLIRCLKLEDMTSDDIDDNEILFGDDGLGLDSVDSIELVLAIENEYDVQIDATKQYDTIFATVSSLLKYINDNKK